MIRQPMMALALILLASCSRENADNKATAKSTNQLPSNASGNTSIAIDPTSESSHQSGNPNLKHLPIANPTSSSQTTDPPLTIALNQLDQQTEHELKRKYLSETTQLHNQYKSEKRQDEWATYVEENLKRHFLTRKFSSVDVAQIGCKTTICEVLAVTRNIPSASTALSDWQEEVYMLHSEPWWQYAEISEPAFQVSSMKDGREFFVTHLIRKSD